MKRLAIAFVLILVVVLGVAFYMKWFRLGSDSTGGSDRITLTVDENKFKDDEKKVQEKLHDAGRKAKDEVSSPTDHK